MEKKSEAVYNNLMNEPNQQNTKSVYPQLTPTAPPFGGESPQFPPPDTVHQHHGINPHFAHENPPSYYATVRRAAPPRPQPPRPQPPCPQPPHPQPPYPQPRRTSSSASQSSVATSSIQHPTVINTNIQLSTEHFRHLQQQQPLSAVESPPKNQQNTVSMSSDWPIWKSGYLEYGKSFTGNASNVGSWFHYYIQLRAGEFRLCGSMENQTGAQTIPLDKDVYTAIQDKKYLCLQYRDNLHVFRCKNENECIRWFVAFTAQTQAGPMMEGYCEKMSGKKKKYETRFMRLSSDGIMTWYISDSDTSSSHGAIQLRGVTSAIDRLDNRVLMSRIGKRDFKFKFPDSTEANAWLKAFTWYTRHTPLKNSKLRNSAKH